MKPIEDQRGIALIFELALVGLVLAVAGVGVYTAVHHKTPVTTDKATLMPFKSASPSATPTPAKPANEFDIPELGFKMTLPTGLSGLKYSYKLDQPGDVNGTNYKVSTVQFTTTALQTADSRCSTDNDAIGIFAKYSFDPKAAGIGDVGKVKKAGQFYLAIEGPQSTCSDNAGVVKQETDQIQLMSTAFDTATPL